MRCQKGQIGRVQILLTQSDVYPISPNPFFEMQSEFSLPIKQSGTVAKEDYHVCAFLFKDFNLFPLARDVHKTLRLPFIYLPS